MKLIKKYLSIFAILAIAAVTACSGGTGGAPAVDIDDGLSSDYFIKSLSVNAPSLYNEDDPNATKLSLKYDFSWGEWSNELDVPYSIDIITITAEKNHNWASLFLGDAETGVPLTSGDASGPINLEVGLNTLTMTVMAQDGQVLVYSIYVTRHTEAHADAGLSTLELAGVDLNPAFDPAGTDRSFLATVATDTISLATFARSEGDGAAVELRVNNDEVADAANIPIKDGMNTLEVICTAGDGTTRETYTINIFKQKPTLTTDLVALSINGVTLNPKFDKDTTEYTASVSTSMCPLRLMAQTDSSTSTIAVAVDGTPTDYDKINLTEGLRVISVTVTNSAAGADAPKTYNINATCTAASTNANLKSLKVGVGTISSRPIHPGTFNRTDGTYHDPASVKFTKTNLNYVTVIYGFTSMKITAVVDDKAAKSVTFAAKRHDGTTDAVSSSSYTDGTATATIDLDIGYVTTISIKVISGADTEQVYTLYAKLLNADEFYWGIYAKPMDTSKSRWTKPVPGTYEGTGLVSGTVKWVVTTAPVSTITLTNYNDGKQGFLYNDGGYVALGAHTAKLKSITVKDGWDVTLNPPFLIKTAESESVAELDYHLWIDNSEPVEATDSYTGIKYLSETWHIQTFKTVKPYPFTSTYNWFESWSDGQ